MKLNKHDDMCPCTRFRAQDEFCTCGAVARDEIVQDTSRRFGERLRDIDRAALTPPPQPNLRVTNPATISDFVSTLSDHGVKLPLLEDDEDIGTLVDADGKPVLVVDVDRERSDEDVAWIRGMIQVAVNTCGGFKAQRAATTEGSAA